MKITKDYLKEIIKEEVEKLEENPDAIARALSKVREAINHHVASTTKHDYFETLRCLREAEEILSRLGR